MAILDTLYIRDCIQSRLYSLYKIMEMLSETNQHYLFVSYKNNFIDGTKLQGRV